MPTNRIDEWSRLLGEMSADLRNLSRSVNDNREEADKRHAENKENFGRIDAKIDSLTMDFAQKQAVDANLSSAAALERAHVNEALSDHDKRLKTWETFHSKFGGIIWVVTAIIVPVVMGALWLLWQGLVWIASFIDFKALAGRIFH